MFSSFGEYLGFASAARLSHVIHTGLESGVVKSTV
jgi:hypothetical protein